MNNVIATVVGGVAVTLIAGALTDWFGIGGPPNRAVAKVVAFNQYGNLGGSAPSASIDVENEGKETAENCVVRWEPGITGAFGVAEAFNSTAFALKGGERQNVVLASQTRIQPGIGWITGKAWVTCFNTTSPPVTVQAYIP